MTKSILFMTAIAMVALAAPVFAATESATSQTKVERDSNGNYDRKTTTENTDAAGTTTENSTEVKVKQDSNGNYKKTVESDSSTDPKGLWNKTTAKSTTTEERNADGSTSYHHKKKINGTTVEDEKTQTN